MVAALPKLLGFAAVLFVGWIMSSLVAKGVAALLHAIRFNDVARRSGIAEFVRRRTVRTDSSEAIAGVAKWLIRLITLVAAFDVLGVPATILVNALLFGVTGGLALAFGLSFGLAGRDRAAQLLEQWSIKPRGLGPSPEPPDQTTAMEVRSTLSRMDHAVDDEDLPEHRSGYDRRRMTRPGSDRRLERNGTMG
jgi:hypothetical protein